MRLSFWQTDPGLNQLFDDDDDEDEDEDDDDDDDDEDEDEDDEDEDDDDDDDDDDVNRPVRKSCLFYAGCLTCAVC